MAEVDSWATSPPTRSSQPRGSLRYDAKGIEESSQRSKKLSIIEAGPHGSYRRAHIPQPRNDPTILHHDITMVDEDEGWWFVAAMSVGAVQVAPMGGR